MSFSEETKVQVIEGKAVRTAGLKSISMRALMVASSNLRFCASLVKNLRKLAESTGPCEETRMACEYAHSHMVNNRANLQVSATTAIPFKLSAYFMILD